MLIYQRILIGGLLPLLGGYISLRAMNAERFKDDTFLLTGKKRYELGWRSPDQNHKDAIEPSWSASFYMQVASDNPTQQSLVSLLAAIGNDINTPVLPKMQGREIAYYLYPIEAAIWWGGSNSIAFEALLNSGVKVDGYQDYSPLKDILVKLALGKNDTEPKILLEFLKKLIKKGAQIDVPLPEHNGFRPDQSSCKRCTARQFLNDQSVQWQDPTIKQSIEEEFKKIPLPQSIVPTPSAHSTTNVAASSQNVHSITTQQQSSLSSVPTVAVGSTQVSTPPGAPPVAATPAIASGPSEVPVGHHSTLSWHNTVSRWCKDHESALSKSTVCIIALAVVAVATKILYNRFASKKTETPSQIIITNESGTTITLGYIAIEMGQLTNIDLISGNTWSLDMNKIKLSLIVTQQGIAEDPLSIKLGRYKASVQQKNKALHITIHKNSGLRYLWTRIPYTYTATWR